jgi:hypothetical protein
MLQRQVFAHRFEEGQQESELSANLEELRAHFGAVESILSDVRMVALASQLAFTRPHIGNIDRISRDLVDQVLLGTINEIVRAVGMSREEGGLRYYWQFRERYEPDQGLERVVS